MTNPSRPPQWRKHCQVSWRLIGACLGILLNFDSPSQAAEMTTMPFNLPADLAARSLKLFADQSGLEVVFASASTSRVKTNGVKGDLTPREAMARLLAGTGLIAEHHPRTGAITIASDPNVQRAAQPEPGDRPNQSASTERNPTGETALSSSW
jgi:hypothetical protein